MLAPRNSLLLGGFLYGCGVYYMSQTYYKQSSFKKIFVKSDKAYEDVKIMHHS